MKILHITAWYPSKENPFEATWIKSHISSLACHVEGQHICHFGIKNARRFSFSFGKSDRNSSYFVLTGPLPWWLIEILSFVGLSFLMFFKAPKYTLVNVHIAYPLLTYFHFIRKWIRRPVVITEHWSSYHFNFGAKKDLPRVQRIFSNGLPLITVSESLKRAIETFSRQLVLRGCVIPNGINAKIFHRRDNTPFNSSVFFMLSHWKWPKRPDVVVRAFAELVQDDEYTNYHLRIGGNGPQLQQIEILIDFLKIRDKVTFLGVLSPADAAEEMNKCSAFLHSAEYETFSVVCAEAICSGTPVMASAVGGIPEFINRTNGILIGSNKVSDWVSNLKSFHGDVYDRTEISRRSLQRFCVEHVGLQYYTFLKEIESHK